MVIRQGAGAALNPDGAARHELRMLRHPPTTEGQPIGRSASLGKRLGGTPLRIETAAFLQHGCLTRAASGARSKRDGTSRCGDRHVRHPPLILLTADVSAASEGVESLRIICAGRSVRNPRGLISRDGPVQPRGPQPINGKCHKDRLVPSPRCKRGPFGQEVRFRPLPTNTAPSPVLTHHADVAGRPST